MALSHQAFANCPRMEFAKYGHRRGITQNSILVTGNISGTTVVRRWRTARCARGEKHYASQFWNVEKFARGVPRVVDATRRGLYVEFTRTFHIDRWNMRIFCVEYAFVYAIQCGQLRIISHQLRIHHRSYT